MAWSNLSGSQMVSFTDAQTSGFALKEGQSHATSLQCMTKSEILAKYTLDIGTTYSNPYASNQLVPVVDWIPKGTGYCPTVSDLSSITTSYSGFGGYGTWTFSFTYIGTQTTTATLWYRTRRDGVYTPNQAYPPHRLTTEFIPGQTYTITAGYAESPTVYLDFELFECSETVIAPYEYYVNYDVNQGTTEGYITSCAFGPAAYKVYMSDSTFSGISTGTVVYQDPYGFPYYFGGVERWLAVGETEDGAVTYGLRLTAAAVIQQKVSCAMVYYNTQQSGTAERNNCPEGYSPGEATLIVSANTYTSSISVADANSQAVAYIDANKQAYANANATCTQPVTVSLGSLTCNTLSGGDSSVIKRWLISTTNPPSGYTVSASKIGTTLGTVSVNVVTIGDTLYAEAVFGNSFAETTLRLSLRNSSGQEVAFGTTAIYGTYSSFMPTCNVYYNTQQSGTATRDNCPAGYTAGQATLTVAANTYTSTISIADANSKAVTYIDANKQAYANANASCTAPIYYNTEQSGTATRNNCSEGYTGGDATLTISANTYSSNISIADANNQAIAYIDANKQAYANANGSCTALTVYYNTQQQLTLAKNDCSEGYSGSDVTLTVAANTYSSYVSVAVANQLAIDYLYDNAQAYANANGTCTLNTPADNVTAYITFAPTGGSCTINKNGIRQIRTTSGTLFTFSAAPGDEISITIVSPLGQGRTAIIDVYNNGYVGGNTGTVSTTFTFTVVAGSGTYEIFADAYNQD